MAAQLSGRSMTPSDGSVMNRYLCPVNHRFRSSEGFKQKLGYSEWINAKTVTIQTSLARSLFHKSIDSPVMQPAHNFDSKLSCFGGSLADGYESRQRQLVYGNCTIINLSVHFTRS